VCNFILPDFYPNEPIDNVEKKILMRDYLVAFNLFKNTVEHELSTRS